MKLNRWLPCLLFLVSKSSANAPSGDEPNGFLRANVTSVTPRIERKEPDHEEPNDLGRTREPNACDTCALPASAFWGSRFDPSWNLRFGFIFYNDFESGWEDFNSGGAYALRDDSSSYASSGNAVLEIYNNFGSASSVITNVIDVSSHLALRMEFWFYPRNFSGGAPVGFALEYKTASVWEEAKYYLYGTDFVNNSWQSDVQLIDTYSASSIEIRIRCDGYGDTVYLDDIELLGLN